MHSKQRQIINSHAFKHAFIQEQIRNWIKIKVVPWSSDTRSSEKLSSDSKFWYVDPLQKQGHICFGTWSPAEAMSHLFWHLIPYRSKVTFVLALDPLQKQGFGHSLFFDSLQKQSHNYLNLLICWPPAEARSHLFWYLIPAKARSWPFFIFRLPAEAKSQLFKFVDMLTSCRSKVTFVLVLDPLQKQGLGFFIFRLPAEAKSQLFRFVDMLTLCRSKVTFVFGTWSPAEARSWPFFIFQLPAKAKSQIFFDMLIPYRSKVTFVFGTWSPAEARSWPFFIFRLPTETKSQIFFDMLIPCRSKVLAILYFSTPCRSKVTITLRDPLQKQDLCICFRHMMRPKQNQCLYLYLIFTLII